MDLALINNFKVKIMPWVICGLAAIFYSYEYLLRISPSVMIPDFMAYYQIDAAMFSFISVLYYYAYAPMQLFVGLLMDWYGPRKLLSISCGLCVIGAYWFGGTSSLWLAGLGRFIVGFGSAFAFVGVLKLATIWLPPDKLALITGLSAALGTIGAMTGNILMTKMVISLGWQHTVFISAYVGIVLTVLLWLFIRDRNNYINNYESVANVEISSHQLISDFVLIIKNPQIWLNGIISCLVYLPATVFAELWGKTYLENVYGLSVEQSAIAIAILFAGFAVGAPITGFISDKIKLRKAPVVIGAVLALIFCLCLIIPAELSVHTVYLILFLLGLSYGTHIINFAIGREVSPKNAAGSALAVTNMLIMLGGILFQPSFGILLNIAINNQYDILYSINNYKLAMSIIPIGIFIAIILSIFLRETNCEVNN